MKNAIRWLGLVSCLVSTVHTHAAMNSIVDIYQHTHNEEHAIERGHLVLLFAHELPKTALIPRRQEISKTHYQLTFIFDNTQMANDLFKKLNAWKEDGYSTMARMQGKQIEFVITYNPNIVEVQHDTYTTRDMKKGLVIRFFDRKFLRQISNKEDCVLQTAGTNGRICINPMRLLV